MAPTRARRQQATRHVAATVEPTRTRSRTIAAPAPRRPLTGRTDRRQPATTHIPSSATTSHDTPQTTAPLLETAAQMTARQQWELSIEERVEQTNQLLQEMHRMLTDQHTNHLNPDIVAPHVNSGVLAPPIPQLSRVTASAQTTTAAQILFPTDMPRVTASGHVGGVNVRHESAGEDMGNRVLLPGVNEVINNLPAETRDRVRALTACSISLHSHIPDKVRAKVWAGEFVELSTLLPESRSTSQEVSLGLQPKGEDGTSVVCYGPKAKPGINCFTQWTKAFRIYMSLYLSQPLHYHEAPQMCKYIETIGDLSERGGKWQAYDDTFRALRMLHGWAWDTVVSEPWLRAAQVANAQAPQRGHPFQSKGVARQPSNNPCFAYNRGVPCDRRRCRYRHKCRRCGAGHPVSQCSAPLRQANTIANKSPSAMPRNSHKQ